MITSMFDENDVRRKLSAKCRNGLRSFCRENGFDAGHVSNMINGHKPISDNMAEFLGYRKVFYYKKINR